MVLSVTTLRKIKAHAFQELVHHTSLFHPLWEMMKTLGRVAPIPCLGKAVDFSLKVGELAPPFPLLIAVRGELSGTMLKSSPWC